MHYSRTDLVNNLSIGSRLCIASGRKSQFWSTPGSFSGEQFCNTLIRTTNTRKLIAGIITTNRAIEIKIRSG